MEKKGFYKLTLPLEGDIFEELSHSVDFEDVTKGRKGNHLVKLGEQGVPIVRTTTQYNQPAHNFSAVHHRIIEHIQQEFSLAPVTFNNALIEIYDQEYTKMKYHSDQCLDLATNSWIALFSCYEHPEELAKPQIRKLKVRGKNDQKEFEFLLEHNSVILFSLETNTHFQHKIVLEPVKGHRSSEKDNRWLGVTFRQSNTFIQFKDGQPYLPNGELLQLADEAQRKEFYGLRGQENRGLDFSYPTLHYTISVADTMMPK